MQMKVRKKSQKKLAFLSKKNIFMFVYMITNITMTKTLELSAETHANFLKLKSAIEDMAGEEVSNDQVVDFMIRSMLSAVELPDEEMEGCACCGHDHHHGHHHHHCDCEEEACGCDHHHGHHQHHCDCEEGACGCGHDHHELHHCHCENGNCDCTDDCQCKDDEGKCSCGDECECDENHHCGCKSGK